MTMVTIDRATPEDLAVISEILGEIEAYYGGEAVPGSVDQITAALFSDHPVATVLLAREASEVLGLASFSFLWPAAGADTSLYLKELYVRETARRRGIAGLFMAALTDAASAAGCSRIEWTADGDNPPALAFYEAYGAEPRGGKVFYRMEK
ncbi:GNAT family N-acetyltransferase [Streptomyces sp. NBC_01750]|uniref:GNAT family N-acetyltransferase n=1 Tax=Streptomyces sp. NBC_01750 TaxID=2975928 RepID=UPI002DDC1B3F|nr:GNAT family N-acetyltransferase [Streptomyces sp. NBC_01750]WSD33440.1 GNAT family N-acetyltransferase [Streptomyces sp. NBC_01750]